MVEIYSLFLVLNFERDKQLSNSPSFIPSFNQYLLSICDSISVKEVIVVDDNLQWAASNKMRTSVLQQQRTEFTQQPKQTWGRQRNSPPRASSKEWSPANNLISAFATLR